MVSTQPLTVTHPTLPKHTKAQNAPIGIESRVGLWQINSVACGKNRKPPRMLCILLSVSRHAVEFPGLNYAKSSHSSAFSLLQELRYNNFRKTPLKSSRFYFLEK